MNWPNISRISLIIIVGWFSQLADLGVAIQRRRTLFLRSFLLQRVALVEAVVMSRISLLGTPWLIPDLAFPARKIYG